MPALGRLVARRHRHRLLLVRRIGQLGLLLAQRILVTFVAVRARRSASPTLQLGGWCSSSWLPWSCRVRAENVVSPARGAPRCRWESRSHPNLGELRRDAARGGVAASFGALVSYATFFPPQTSGPLLRFDTFDRQRLPFPIPDPALIEIGAVGVIVGLAKKVLVADPLGNMVEPLFADFDRLGSTEPWLAVLATVHTSCSSTSPATRTSQSASGRCSAFVSRRTSMRPTPPPTSRPSGSARWHMTMSRWFRDYLFLP